MRLSLLVPIAFVVFMTLWAVHSIHGLLRWWGPALILAGALGLLAGLANAPLIGLALAVGLPYLPPPAPELIESAPDVVLALGHAVAVPVMAQSVLVLLAGVILSLVALVLHSRQHRRQTGNAASGR